jgi:hypothetical protein
MRRVWVFVVLVLAVMLPYLRAAEKPYEMAKIVDVQQKAHTRVLYYLSNTPVTQDDPYFEVSVQAKEMIYIGEYTPIHSSQTLPEEWRPDAVVKARIEKRHMFLKRLAGDDLDFVIIKRTHVESAPAPTPPAKQ